jgi:hypothetical protein
MKDFGEPWYLSDCSASSKEVKAFNDMGVGVLDGFGDEFYRRIVACVNFCNGIETEKLEKEVEMPGIGLFGKIAARLTIENKQLTAQRDELLAALTHAVTDYIDQNGMKPSWWTEKIVAMVKEGGK